MKTINGKRQKQTKHKKLEDVRKRTDQLMDKSNAVRRQSRKHGLNFRKKEFGSLTIGKISPRQPKYNTQQNQNRNPVLNEITNPFNFPIFIIHALITEPLPIVKTENVVA